MPLNRLCRCGHRELEHDTTSRGGVGCWATLDPSPRSKGYTRFCGCFRFDPDPFLDTAIELDAVSAVTAADLAERTEPIYAIDDGFGPAAPDDARRKR